MGNSLSAASESDDEAAPRPGLVLRAKRLLIAPLLLLKRLRRAKATPEDEAEEASPGARNARRAESDDATEAPAAPPLWRRFLPYGLVLLAGAVAGGGAIYWLSAQVIALQATELGERQDEIARLKGVLAGYDRMMLKNSRKLEEEQGKRAETENRLAIAQTDLTRRPPPGDARGTGGQAAAGAGKAADCTLRPGSIGSTLKGCLEEFNRQ
ncbi:MAG: hypothetical protein HZC23_05210 [Rhodocyclales bacterium]|nr:hypothetical protein [Rhodocyclales bacterium]